MQSHLIQEVANQLTAEKLRLDGTSQPLAGLQAKAEVLDAGFRRLNDVRFDAAESAFLTRQLLFIQAREVTQMFVETQALKFFPVDTSIPSGAEGFSTPIWNVFGKAKLIANYATDFPSVDAAQTENILPIRSLGVSFSYSAQDLRRASMAGGMPLDQRKASVARLVNDQLVDTIASLGDTTSGLLGVTQNSQATVLTAGGGTITGAWASASAATIYADLMAICGKPFTQSKGLWRANTLLLPTAAYAKAASTPFSTLNGESVLSVFLRTNPFGITQADMWPALDTAGASSATRAMVYKRDSVCVDIKIPQPFEVFAPQQENLAFKIPCHSRIGGAVVYHPLSMVYADGL